MFKRTINMITLIITICICNAGCNRNNLLETQLAISPSISHTTIVEQTPTITLTRVSINTLVSTPNKLESLKIEDTPLPTTTWTPLPTIESGDVYQVIHQMMDKNGNCILPCWFGMDVGKTNWNEATYNLNSLGLNKSIYNHNNLYEYLENENYLNWSVQEKEKIISEIGIGTNFTEQFGLSSLLINVGTPDEVYLNTASDVPGYPQHEPYLPFSLVLYYREANMLIQYYLEGQNDGAYINACFKNPKIMIYIWEPSLKSEGYSKYRLNVAGGGVGDGRKYLKDFFTVTEFSPESFTEYYKNKENNCIQTPVEYWPVF